MKKLVFSLILILLLLSGCGRKAQDSQPELILRYADNQPEDYPTTQAAEYFAQLVEERTQGKICIRVYANAELGDELSVMDQVRFGGIDMARLSVGTLTEVYPDTGLLQLPYLYDDAEHMWRVLDSEIGDDFLAGSRQAGFIGLSWFDAGARSFYTREHVTCLEDLRGLQIRVQESDFMSSMVELLGATATQIPYGNVYSALQTGTVDGAENNWPSYASTGHFEAAPYFLRDEHTRLPEMQVISTVALDKIAEVDVDYVTIIQECARESAIYERQLWKEAEQNAEQRLLQLGCVVTELPAQEKERFRQAVEPMYEGYDRELIDRIRNS